MILSAFKTYVLQDFKRTDKEAELVQAYNDAIIDLATRMPHGGYKYQSYIPTVIVQEDYPLPSDLIHLIHPARLLEGSGTNDSGYQMDFITKQEYDSYEVNPNRTSPSSGKPMRYTVYSRSILLSPIPDKNTYLVEIDWSKRPVVLSGDNDVHSLGSEWDEILKHMVLTRLNSGIELFQEAEFWRSRYEDQMGTPIGMLRRLLDIERDREYKAVSQVKVNDL